MTERDPEATRWSPDDQLIPAVLAGSRTTMGDLGGADRAWVVVGLYYDEGLTAESIADRLDCSVRLVRSTATDPTGQVMRAYRDQADNFDMDRRMAHSEVARLTRALAEAERDRDRYARERNRLIERLADPGGPRFRCGHAKTRYNTYQAPKTGKIGCRQCRADAQARYRAKRKAVTVGVQTGQQEVVPDGQVTLRAVEGHARRTTTRVS